MRAAAAAQVLVDDPGAPVLEDAARHHLERVLRLRDGEAVVATDGAGRWARCRYRRPGTLELDGEPAFEPPRPPGSRRTVAFAPAKGDRPEWVVQKLTELGVDRVVVLAAERAVVRWDGDRAASALARLRRVADEAACQSRRVWLPVVDGVATLAEVLGPGAALAQPGAAPLGSGPAGGVTTIAVGPEGGWSEGELARAGTALVGLSDGVLRSETAAVAAGALLTASRHEMGESAR